MISRRPSLRIVDIVGWSLEGVRVVEWALMIHVSARENDSFAARDSLNDFDSNSTAEVTRYGRSVRS